MSGLARLALVGFVRSPARTAIRVLTLAAAAALLGAMLLFVGHSLRTMTATATRSVPLDWQGPVGSYQSDVRVARGVAAQPGVLESAPAATGPFAGIEHRAAVGTIHSGGGSILAVPPGYLRGIHTFRVLRGSLRPGEIVFDQQLAATLQVQPGDVAKLTVRPGTKPLRFRVSGVALVTAPDVLFQPLNPVLGPAPAQPPSDIAILPLHTFATKVAPLLQAIPPAGGGTAAIPGVQTGVQWQVHAQVDPAALRGSPARAFNRANQVRNAVERSLPGQVQFVDNLSDTLNSAAGDALYAETLYIMLAVPGALVALALAYLAALGTVERDRRDLSLLRARGASRSDLLALAAFEGVAIGLVAGAIGTGAALLAVHMTASGGGIGPGRALATLGICVMVAAVGAAIARIGASLTVFRGSVVEGRRAAVRERKPLWQRVYLDLVCLGLSGLVYWLTARTGFSAVINPDSNPTLSLSVYMFLAPALLWIGATLLLVRLRGRFVGRLAAWAAGRRASSPTRFLLASAGRRGAAINRGLIVIGLLLAFGVNLALFTATYDQQARVDAQLTLGADVVVTAPPGVVSKRNLVSRIERTPGASGVTALDHSYAYVGPDLQDIFGIDPSTLTHGTSLRDSYFLGGTAKQMVSRLAGRPDGVLVSQETITDYSLKPGDLVELRLLHRATGRFHVVPFHVVGVVQEFPAAPRDSFMVANLGYVEGATNDPGPNVVFVRSAVDPVGLSQRIAADTRREGTLVKNIRQQTVQTVSSITTVDLGGISRIEGAFALFLAAAAMALFVGVALAERRQEFATMAALGKPLRSIAAFLWTEAALVLAGAFVLAVVLGWLLAEMLIAMLQHVFDPPPDHLAAPWGYLAALAGSALLGTLLAAAVAIRGIRRLGLGAILREE